MGTIFAPTFPTSTMGYFEVHFYDMWKLKWGRVFQEFILENWSCLFDDFQSSLDKNNLKPLELLGTLNSINEAIELTKNFLYQIF